MLKKTSEARPLAAKVVNVNNNSQTDAYSCDYINDCNTYSTSEVNTGKKWIDGKSIYRKVLDKSNIGTAFGTGVSGIDKIFFDASHSYIYYDASTSFPIDRARFKYITSSNTIIAEESGVSTWKTYLTIEYTKSS